MKKLNYNLVVLGFIFILLNLSLFKDSKSQWVQMSTGLGTTQNIQTLAVLGTNIYAGTYNAGVFMSTNNGTNWTAVNSGLVGNALSVNVLVVSGTNLIAGTESDSSVYLSTNNGTSWSAISHGLYSSHVSSFVFSGSTIFAGAWNTGVFKSTNNGANWISVNNGFTSGSANALAILGTDLFAGTSGSGVYKSTNNGANWFKVNSGFLYTSTSVYSLFAFGTDLYAGSSDGLFKTTNNGINWFAVTGITNQESQFAFASLGSNLFVAPFGSGVFLSTNNGLSWLNKNQGLNSISGIQTLLIANNYIFSGSISYSLWRRSYSEIISIQNISSEIPSKYSLSQNYPNPFNPTTNVKFDIAKVGDVKIVVYDIMGREVQTLVNESLKHGTYEASFDGSKLNSGVYFYKLVTDGFTETKKMLLIK